MKCWILLLKYTPESLSLICYNHPRPSSLCPSWNMLHALVHLVVQLGLAVVEALDVRYLRLPITFHLSFRKQTRQPILSDSISNTTSMTD